LSERGSPSPRLRLSGIVKRYGETLANDGIDLTVLPGEIHALLGENGAGKSTLVKIIYGVVKPDAGELAWEGKPVAIASPNVARALGIGMVFQHFSLFETLTVVENIALGLAARDDLKRLAERVREVAQRYALAVDPWRHVHELSVGERQRVEIVRCLLQEPRLLIMDEPTSVLTPQEVDGLFTMLRRLAESGCSILYISHKLDEIMALCHRATVLRAGRVSGECDPRRESAESLAQMMIGSALPVCRRPALQKAGEVALAIDRLTLASADPFGTSLKDLRLEIRAGEVVGIAGVAGNGQSELLAALSGERRAERAEVVRIAGKAAGHLGPAARRRLGLAFIPEERLGRGAVAELSLAENALLTSYDRFARHGILRFAELRAYARRILAERKVVAAGIAAEAKSLSGGNMQKFIVGREVGLAPKVLLAAHPTWGVDVGAATAIHQALVDLAAGGAAVLVVSEDLEELFEICDRIAVLCAGRLSPARRAAETTVEEVGLWMAGMFEGARPERESLDAA
jgi:general nucleoside transport system ATP-binding protein